VHGDNGPLLVIADGAAQLAHRVGQRLLHHDHARPKVGQQLFLGHHLAGVTQQQAEHLQRLGLDLHHRLAHAQLAAALVKCDVAETPEVIGIGFRRLQLKLPRGGRYGLFHIDVRGERFVDSVQHSAPAALAF